MYFQAVLEEISRRAIRSLFSTHYHSLSHNPPAGCCTQHMECHVEHTAEGVDQVTFLYTLANGSGYGYEH